MKSNLAVNIYHPTQYVKTTIVHSDSGHITKAEARAWFWSDVFSYLLLGFLYVLQAVCYGVGVGLLISLLNQ